MSSTLRWVMDWSETSLWFLATEHRNSFLYSHLLPERPQCLPLSWPSWLCRWGSGCPRQPPHIFLCFFRLSLKVKVLPHNWSHDNTFRPLCSFLLCSCALVLEVTVIALQGRQMLLLLVLPLLSAFLLLLIPLSRASPVMLLMLVLV